MAVVLVEYEALYVRGWSQAAESSRHRLSASLLVRADTSKVHTHAHMHTHTHTHTPARINARTHTDMSCGIFVNIGDPSNYVLLYVNYMLYVYICMT